MNIIHHVAFNCRDRHAQETFYTELFGFRRARVFHAGQPDEFVMLRLGDMCLELFGVQAPGESGGAPAVGFKHLAFEVPDLEEAMSRLRAMGIEPDRTINLDKITPGFRICFFRDPDGNVVELMQGWRDE